MMIEQAKKELEKLETQHPDSFQSLKLDLKTFISQLEDERNQYYSTPTTTASTHVSSTRKKRKKENSDVKEMKDDDEAESKMWYMKKRRSCCDVGKRRDVSSDAANAIERARVCLQKVQKFKTTFLHY